MLALKNTYLISLISAILLFGCGGDGDSENYENYESYEGYDDDNGSDETPVTPIDGVATFELHVMPVLVNHCKSCHGSDGDFTITTASATYANISDLKSSVAEAGKYLYDKGSNTVGHGGGRVISTSSTEYQTLKSWVDSGADFN